MPSTSLASPVSAVRKVLQVGFVLRPSLCLLHLAQSGKGAHPHRDAEQVALHGVFGELRVARHAAGSLDYIQPSEVGVGGYVPATTNYSTIGCGIEPPSLYGREGGAQIGEDLGDALNVPRRRP